MQSPSPIDWTRLLPPKLELLPTVRKIDRTVPSGCVHRRLDLGADGRTVRLGPDEFDFQPVAAACRVLEQQVVCPIARRRPAGLDEQVEGPVAVPVSKRDTMALLEVAGARGLASRPQTARRRRS